METTNRWAYRVFDWAPKNLPDFGFDWKPSKVIYFPHLWTPYGIFCFYMTEHFCGWTLCINSWNLIPFTNKIWKFNYFKLMLQDSDIIQISIIIVFLSFHGRLEQIVMSFWCVFCNLLILWSFICELFYL